MDNFITRHAFFNLHILVYVSGDASLTTDPNYAQPWQMRPQRSSSGSAFIVDTKRRHIMTNAHVVRWSGTTVVLLASECHCISRIIRGAPAHKDLHHMVARAWIGVK